MESDVQFIGDVSNFWFLLIAFTQEQPFDPITIIIISRKMNCQSLYKLAHAKQQFLLSALDSTHDKFDV